MKQHSASSPLRAARNLASLAIVVLWAFTAIAFAAGTGNLEQELQSKYKDKVVMLRNYYCGQKLKFDANENLVSGGESGPWTVCRDIRIEGIKATEGKITIAGRRIYLRYDSKQREFRDVTLDIPNVEKQKKQYQDMLDAQKVVIEARLPAGADNSTIESSMNRLFYASDQDFLGSVLGIWRTFFHSTDKTETSTSQPVEHVGKNNVTRPESIYTPDPNYSDEARKAKYQGILALNLIVDSSGAVSNVSVIRPLGMGLDERAAAQVATWKFKPALKDGKPVPVEVSVEVSFNLY